MADFDFVIDQVASPHGTADYYSLKKLEGEGHDLATFPYSIRVLLENSLRQAGGVEGAAEAAHRLLDWPGSVGSSFPFVPYRVLLQDYTGVPLIVDLAAMREAMKRLGKNPNRVNSVVPIDLVIDHSVQVDAWSNATAFSFNLEKEYERNSERYSLLKWAQSSFRNLKVFPPGKGICHQVNLEYLSSVVALSETAGRPLAVPDTLVGTDSHTTMVNGLGVLGWGVGGIEAEAVMLGEPHHMTIPRVVGVDLVGSLAEGSTPTDVVLTVTEALRERGVVDSFVEYFGEGYRFLSVPDRATLGNMSPEYGATVGFSPVDSATLRYLLDTGRTPAHVRFVEEYCKRQAFFALPDSEEPSYSEIITIDLGRIQPCIAGPRNPDERRLLRSIPAYASSLIESAKKSRGLVAAEYAPSRSPTGGQVALHREDGIGPGHEALQDGSVIIAAITSCTNTSNPTVMIGAGLLARNASLRGLKPKPYVKCSLAPGSTVVKDYLEGSGLLSFLDRLGFNLVGYGCASCIGNSGPLEPAIELEIKKRDLYTVAVLSGNRNFDGRIHPLARGAFLMSPMLVVAYALAGRIDFDFYNQPLGKDDRDGSPVFLRDLWPGLSEIQAVASSSLNSELYAKRYADALIGDRQWNALAGHGGDTFDWVESSTYIREPPWFGQGTLESKRDDDEITHARALVLLGDKVTTDHISPAGTIMVGSPAGEYLLAKGVDVAHFSTYGSRRGNHEVLVRGGFANIRLRNKLADGKEGGYTKHFPTGEVLPIFVASQRYEREGVPLIVLAGKEYGSGSSRDWAAKAPKMLGVRAVIAESFERIHRSNLLSMGILPLEFNPGENVESLRIKGDEFFTMRGLRAIAPGGTLSVIVEPPTGDARQGRTFEVKARIDSEAELRYYAAGGILPYFLNRELGAL